MNALAMVCVKEAQRFGQHPSPVAPCKHTFLVNNNDDDNDDDDDNSNNHNNNDDDNDNDNDNNNNSNHDGHDE